MHSDTFQRLRDVILRESGIALGDDKQQLVENRLRKRLRALNLASDTKYLEFLETDLSGEELVHLIDAISTNLTFFYRERAHFDLLAKFFREWTEQGRKQVRGWCAAASSGEEPYTLAMTAAENFPVAQGAFRLLATDICITVLGKALRGQYRADQFRDMTPQLISRYFSPVAGTESDLYQVAPALMGLILFKRLNLARFPYPLKGGLDFIFCRNVMIYFKSDLRQKLIEEFWRLLKPGGYLFVGHSESLSGLKHRYEFVQSAVYQKGAA